MRPCCACGKPDDTGTDPEIRALCSGCREECDLGHLPLDVGTDTEGVDFISFDELIDEGVDFVRRPSDSCVGKYLCTHEIQFKVQA